MILFQGIWTILICFLPLKPLTPSPDSVESFSCTESKSSSSHFNEVLHSFDFSEGYSTCYLVVDFMIKVEVSYFERQLFYHECSASCWNLGEKCLKVVCSMICWLSGHIPLLTEDLEILIIFFIIPVLTITSMWRIHPTPSLRAQLSIFSVFLHSHTQCFFKILEYSCFIHYVHH